MVGETQTRGGGSTHHPTASAFHILLFQFPRVILPLYPFEDIRHRLRDPDCRLTPAGSRDRNWKIFFRRSLGVLSVVCRMKIKLAPLIMCQTQTATRKCVWLEGEVRAQSLGPVSTNWDWFPGSAGPYDLLGDIMPCAR